MTNRPMWLPIPLTFGGDWETFEEQIYQVFRTELLLTPKPVIDGRVVLVDNRVLEGEAREEGFWHLVTREDAQTGDRLPDLKRAEKLCWIKAIIENCDKPEVLVWNYREDNGKIRTYLWLKDHEFAVVLEKGRKVMFLVTAFQVDASYRRSLMRKHSNRQT